MFSSLFVCFSVCRQGISKIIGPSIWPQTKNQLIKVCKRLRVTEMNEKKMLDLYIMQIVKVPMT